MVRDTSPSQDAYTHQIWNFYLKEYRRYAPDIKRDGRTVRLLYASQSSFGGIKTDIADTLGEAFCHNLSSFNYSESFRKIITKQEKVKLNLKSQNNEIYNKDFNLDELVEAILTIT